MAFSGSDPINAKQRFFNALQACPQVYNLAMSLYSWLMQQGGRPDMQVVELDHGTATAQVICGAAATLRALVLRKTTTTAAFAKISDHATDFSSSAVTVLIKQAALGQMIVAFPSGLAHATGITFESHTTCDGSTTSAAGDGASGVALISA
jgi:hypothetical protein